LALIFASPTIIRLQKLARSGGKYFNVVEGKTVSVWLALDDAMVDDGCRCIYLANIRLCWLMSRLG
jgi:hypothetical protein